MRWRSLSPGIQNAHNRWEACKGVGIGAGEVAQLEQASGHGFKLPELIMQKARMAAGMGGGDRQMPGALGHPA